MSAAALVARLAPLRRLLGYNVINAAQIALSAAFQILLVRAFGASVWTDAYLISLVIVEYASMVGVLFTEMFIQYYHEVRTGDRGEAARFYQVVANVTLLTGLGTFLLARLGADVITRALAPGFEADRLAALRAVFAVLSVSIVWNTVNRLTTLMLKAEMRFLVPYASGLLVPAANIVAVLVLAPRHGIMAVAMATVVAGLAALVVQQVYLAVGLGVRPALRLWHPRLGALMRSSVVLRLGHQIWDARDLIATSVLSALPAGTVTLYVYAAKLSAIMFAVINSAVLEVFFSETSEHVSHGRLAAIQAPLRRTLRRSLGLFVAALVPAALLLPPVLTVLFGARMGPADRAVIYHLFLLFVPFYLILSLELPYVAVVIALRRAGTVVMVSSASLAVFWATVRWLVVPLGVYGVPLSLALAQATNLVVYRLRVRAALRDAPEPA